MRCANFLTVLPMVALIGGSAAGHQVFIDGDGSDWTGAAPLNINTGHITRTPALQGEYVWTDRGGDERTDFSAPDGRIDITEFRITADTQNLYFLVRMSDIDQAFGDGAPQIQVAIDRDRQPASGQTWLAAMSDTQVSAAAAWEYLVMTRFGSGVEPSMFDTFFNDYSGASAAISDTADLVEIAIPWSLIGGAPSEPLRFTVASLRTNVFDEAWDPDGAGGSDVLDVVTTYGNPGSPAQNTWAEVSEGVVDYHFEIWFHLDPDLEPSPPVIVNEVMYDSTENTDIEWIELYNLTGLVGFSLEGWKLGDEETVDGGEGMYAMPAGALFPASQLFLASTQGNPARFGFVPDAEIPDNTAAPQMTRYSNWATGTLVLGNNDDEVLLLDPFDTVVDVLVYGNGVYPGVTPAVDVQGNADHSLERPQPRGDSNDCAWDYFEQDTPTPGGLVQLWDNGYPCTAGNRCLSGFCVDGYCCESACDGLCDGECNVSGSEGHCLPRDCDDSDLCTTDGCDPQSGCTHAPVICQDGDLCTEDTCLSAQGCVFNSVTCDDQNPCTDDSCNPQTGCVFTDNSAACDDGSACTENDVCANGVCQGSDIVCDDQNPCTDDSCNPQSGCVFTNNSAACDDGDACTEGDTCAGGVCRPGGAASCDDQNPCTDDSCVSPGGCVHAANSGAACDDGNACTMQDACAGGQCTGLPLDADGDGYVAAACGGNDCNDSQHDINPGAFEGPGSSPACHDDLDNDCDGQKDGADPGCQACGENSDCDDLNVCNGTETCQQNACQPGTPLVCNDQNPCTNDSCDPQSGCVYTNNTAACDDGDACTVGDACSGGSCHGGGARDCNDQNPCTDDSCDSSSGCLHTNNTAACDDGNACTVADACSAGACQGSQKDCSSLAGPCRQGVCDPESGQCQAQVLADGTPCDDGLACTLDDTCRQGECRPGVDKCGGSGCGCATPDGRGSWELWWLLAFVGKSIIKRRPRRGAVR